MRCTEAQMQLLRCRNEAELSQRTVLARHLRGCPQCRRGWQQAQALNGLLAALPDALPDAGFTQLVMAEIWREPSLAPPAAASVRAAAGQGRGLVAALAWGPAAAAQVADWTLAMITTFAVSALVIALLSNGGAVKSLQPLLQLAPARIAALTAWLPDLGASIMTLTDRLLTLLNSLQLPAF